MYRQSEKKLFNSSTSFTCPYNMMNFGPLTAEIGSGVWGTPANFNGFRVLAALLHGTLVVGVSQTLRRWTEGATYIRQGGHHVGHWPILVLLVISAWLLVSLNNNKITVKHCGHVASRVQVVELICERGWRLMTVTAMIRWYRLHLSTLFISQYKHISFICS